MDSQKRGHAGYCKTFAKLCIDWALDSPPSPNHPPIRSSDLEVTVALVQQWTDEIYGGPGAVASSDDLCLAKLAAQYGADQELDACCELLVQHGFDVVDDLRATRRPQPKSLKEKALAALERYAAEEWCEEMAFDSSIIREALEQLDD